MNSTFHCKHTLQDNDDDYSKLRKGNDGKKFEVVENNEQVRRNLNDDNSLDNNELQELKESEIFFANMSEEEFDQIIDTKKQILFLMETRDRYFYPYTEQWDSYSDRIDNLRQGLIKPITDIDVPWRKQVIMEWYRERDYICKPYSTRWRLFDRCLWHQKEIFPESSIIKFPFMTVKPYGKAHADWLKKKNNH